MKRFFDSSICKNNINYWMSLLYIIVANVLIYYAVVEDVFQINFGKEKPTLTFILYMFGEFLTLVLARCICISGEKPKDNTLLYN